MKTFEGVMVEEYGTNVFVRHVCVKKTDEDWIVVNYEDGNNYYPYCQYSRSNRTRTGDAIVYEPGNEVCDSSGNDLGENMYGGSKGVKQKRKRRFRSYLGFGEMCRDV